MNPNSKRVIICVREGRAVCPVCGRRTNVRLLPETRLRSYPLFCVPEVIARGAGDDTAG